MTRSRVKTNPELLPPRRETTPRGTPTIVQLDEEAFAVGFMDALKEFGRGDGVDGGIHAAEVDIALRAEGEGKVGSGEGGDVVLVGLPRDRFMLLSVAQAHEEILRIVINDGGRGGGGDFWRGRVGDVGHEDLIPVGGSGSGAHVLNIKHGVVKVLVEDARLDFVRSL